MPKLEITAPDGELLTVDLTPDDKPENYDQIADEVIADYEASKVESPGVIKSGALGVMSGVPGAQTVVDTLSSLGDKTFEEARKETEIQKDKAWEEHPVAYGTGKTAGMVGTAMAVPTSIPAAVGLGAAAGLDATKKPADMIEDVAKGAVMGGAFGSAAKYIAEPAIGAVVNKIAPAIGKRTVAAMGEPTLETVESYLKNPERIRQALSGPQVAEKLAESVGKMGDKTDELSAAARGLLNPESAPITTPLPKLPRESTGLVNASGQEIMKDLTRTQTIVPDTLTPIFESLKSKYLQNGIPKSDAAESALRALNAQQDRIAKIAQATGGKLDEVAIKEQIVELQKMAKSAFGDDAVASTTKEALKNLSGALNGILKEANPAYKEAMVPVAQRTGLASNLAETFGLEGGKATDKTVRQVGSLLNEPKIEEQDLARKLQEATGMDLLDMVKAAQQRGEFAAGETGSALKTLFASLGFGAGKMTGVPFGGIGGAALGRFGSEGIHGANLAKRILDIYLDKSAKWQNSALKASLDKYGPVLANAAKQGGNKLAATHFVLATSEPDYQALESEISKE